MIALDLICISTLLIASTHATPFAKGAVESCYPISRALPRSYYPDGTPTINKPDDLDDRSLWWCAEDLLNGFVALNYPTTDNCNKEKADDFKVMETDLETISSTSALLVDLGSQLDGCTDIEVLTEVFDAAFRSLGVKLTLSKTYGGLETGWNQALKVIRGMEDAASFILYSIALVDFNPQDEDTFNIDNFMDILELIREGSQEFHIPIEFKSILGKQPSWFSRATEGQKKKFENLITYWDYRTDVSIEQCLDAEASALAVIEEIKKLELTDEEHITVTASWITHPQETRNRNERKNCGTDDGFFKTTPEDAAAFLKTLADCSIYTNYKISFNAGVFSDENDIGLGFYGNRTEDGSCAEYVPWTPELCRELGSSTTTPTPPTLSTMKTNSAETESVPAVSGIGTCIHLTLAFIPFLLYLIPL